MVDRFLQELANAVERNRSLNKILKKKSTMLPGPNKKHCFTNRAKGEAEAQRLQAEAPKASGVIRIQRMGYALASGRQLPEVLVVCGKDGVPPLLLDLGNQKIKLLKTVAYVISTLYRTVLVRIGVDECALPFISALA